MSSERFRVFEAHEPLPSATQRLLDQPRARKRYNPNFLDTAVVASMGIVVPVVTFRSMSRFIKERPTLHSYPQLYASWYGITAHVFERHDEERDAHFYPKKDCECPLCAYIQRDDAPNPPYQNRYAFTPATIDEFIVAAQREPAHFQRMRITPVRLEVLKECMDGIRVKRTAAKPKPA